MNTVEEIKKRIGEEFNEYFYEGERNSVYCKKHNLFATPCELKCFLDSVVDKVYSQAKLEVMEEIEKFITSYRIRHSESYTTTAEELGCDVLSKLTELKSTLVEDK